MWSPIIEIVEGVTVEEKNRVIEQNQKGSVMTLKEKLQFLLDHWETKFEYKPLNSPEWKVGTCHLFRGIALKNIHYFEFREVE